MRPEFDARDQEILNRNMRSFDKIENPRVGDYVRFANGVERRISHVHAFAGEPKSEWTYQTSDYQTSDDGSWYLGDGFCSFSGSLYRSVPHASLTLTGAIKTGRVWFFHHDYPQAHCGVGSTPIFRVYTCNLPAPD